jgi:DNA-binding transcriptional MocR family regulator
MFVSERYRIDGADAQGIARSVERAVRDRRLLPGAVLPTVRGLADELAVSPTTVAAAYRVLRQRGVVQGEGRRGTRVSGPRSVRTRTAPAVPAGVRDLATGAPDARLLPRYGPWLRELQTVPRLYDEPAILPELHELVTADFAADLGAAGPVAIVSGALDGMERVLGAVLRPGDRVAVEDPGYANLLDLVAALGLVAEPVPIDEQGMRPDALEAALRAGAAAVLVTPRAQNPTGAALTAARGRRLRSVLAAHPGVLVVEDDHAAVIAGADYVPLGRGQARRALIRSVSKTLGPDLRLAALTGDEETVSAVIHRQEIGAGWVPRLVQELVAKMLGSASVRSRIRAAAGTYADRRQALVTALDGHGVSGHGTSGLNVWVPVVDETAAVQSLFEAGWAVGAGERFRLHTGPGVRITVAALDVDEAPALAAAVAAALRPGRYAG